MFLIQDTIFLMISLGFGWMMILKFIIALLVYSSFVIPTIAQPGWLINDRNLFLTIIEAGSLRETCQYGQVRAFLVEHLSLCSHLAKEAGELCRVS